MKTPGNKQEQEKASDVLWRAVSAPGFSLMILGIWLVWLLLATQVPQGTPDDSVFGQYRFGVSEAIVNGNLHDALRSWVVGLLSLVSCLAIIARILRDRSLDETTHVGAEVHLGTKTPPEVGRWIEGSLGITRWGEDRGTIKGVRGRFAEGAMLVGIAVIMLLVGSAMEWNQLNGIVRFIPGEAGNEQWSIEKTLVRGPGGWTEAELRVGLQCSSLEPPGSKQTFNCQVKSGDESFQGPVSEDAPLVTKWGVLRLRRFARKDNSLGAFSVESLTSPGEILQMGKAGETYQLNLSEENEFQKLRMRLHVSQGGNLATVEATDKDKVWILSELPEQGLSNPPIWIRAYGQPFWEMEWVASRAPYWFYASMLIGLLGAILVTFIPHLRLEAVLREDGGYLVRLSSLNRPLLPKQLCDKAEISEGGT